ncbi:hypothetical protein DFP72DRAFT_817123 [Ephemerocybe angulata]|uniref:Uncharacterized protein n=1 Tax=Ephemerocybe angulata TaxID=980116 RepID=A0A8H6HQ00_9AGAR|nr:hypothetical protein DFP72DRAFT_817123 [Tulosesus angulatus]
MGIQHSLSPLFTVIAFFLFLSSLYGQSNAARNVTVDDSDAAIEYEGIWDPEPASDPASQGGSHKVANDPSAKAMFKFNGTAVYVWFPKWSYGVSALLSLDGSDPELVNLEDDTKDPSDSAVDPSTVLRYWDGLDDGMEHTLMFEKGPGFLVLDMITSVFAEFISSSRLTPT